MEHGCDALWISCQAGRKVITYATNKSQELGFLGRNFPFIKMEFVKNIQYTWKAMSFPSAYKQAGCVLLGFLHLLHGDPGPRCFMKGRKRQILSIHQWPENTESSTCIMSQVGRLEVGQWWIYTQASPQEAKGSSFFSCT